MTTVIYHNPTCGTSRNVLAILRAAGADPVVIDYLSEGWTRPQLLGLFAAAGLTPRAPLTLLDRAQEADRWCRSVLAGRPVEDGGFLPEGGVLEPELWFELAALTPRRAELVEADTSHGVGRYVAAWEI